MGKLSFSDRRHKRTDIPRKRLPYVDRLNLALLEREGCAFADFAERTSDGVTWVQGLDPYHVSIRYEGTTEDRPAQVWQGNSPLPARLWMDAPDAGSAHDVWVGERVRETLPTMDSEMSLDHVDNLYWFLTDLFKGSRSKGDEKDLKEFAKSYYRDRYDIDVSEVE